MTVHGLLAEMLIRAPGLILGNVNYVKKVVFPLEILPVISLGATLFHSLINFLVLIIAFAVLNGYAPWTIIFAPLVLLPLAVFSLGLAWLLASLGVFIRDIGQTMGVIITVLLFTSPVFFPISSVPARFQPIMMANPLSFIIEQTRSVLIWGKVPNWQGLALYFLAAVLVAILGFTWFQKTRKGFADVL